MRTCGYRPDAQLIALIPILNRLDYNAAVDLFNTFSISTSAINSTILPIK